MKMTRTDKLESIFRSDKWQCPAKVFFFKSAKKQKTLKQKTKNIQQLHIHVPLSFTFFVIRLRSMYAADMHFYFNTVLVDKGKVNVFVTAKSI